MDQHALKNAYNCLNTNIYSYLETSGGQNSNLYLNFVQCKSSYNGTTRFKNVSNCFNTNIYSYLETSGGQSSNLCLNVVQFFNTSANYTSVAA